VPDPPGPSARRPLRRDAEHNRERILAAARELVGEHGLSISHDDIARAADVGVGTVYRRFPTREELFDELFYEQLDVMVATAQAAAEADDPWQGICQFLEQIFEQQAANRGLRELLIGHRGGTELSRRAQSRLRPVVARLVEAARESGQLRAGVGETDLAMIPVMINPLVAASREVDPELWRRWLAAILDGIAADPRRDALPGAPPTPDQVAQIIKGRPPSRPPRT
jgi:AcrR family transcriptional regulator